LGEPLESVVGAQVVAGGEAIEEQSAHHSDRQPCTAATGLGADVVGDLPLGHVTPADFDGVEPDAATGRVEGDGQVEPPGPVGRIPLTDLLVAGVDGMDVAGALLSSDMLKGRVPTTSPDGDRRPG